MIIHCADIDNGRETVSKLLEGIYDDYCVAQMAKALGKWTEFDSLFKVQ
ncbi:glycoside hydrolase family 92 protein [Bacteroides sp. HF-5092]|nr:MULTISPECIES: glycoside hydrolase domain-containing protein [Bacteroides]TRX45981.1 glycoside hydrolase family 92 protein [Bacteroides sp. HF-5092]